MVWLIRRRHHRSLTPDHRAAISDGGDFKGGLKAAGHIALVGKPRFVGDLGHGKVGIDKQLHSLTYSHGLILS